jgi:hypothetical protein
MGMERWLRLGAGLLIAFAMVACSDDSSDGDSSSGTGGGTAVTGGTGGVGGTGGTSTGTGGTGGTSGTGGTMTTAGTAAMVMCDTSIPTTATCGGTSCPAGAGLTACQVPCCAMDGANEVCGFRVAAMDNVTDCEASPPEDPDCPDYDNGNVQLQGCCYDGNTCGFISTFSNTCIITSMFLSDLASMAGAACDGSDNDAGMEMPADGGP